MDIKKKKQINLVVFITIVLILCGLMTFYMSKKEGFHEDEMFTYDLLIVHMIIYFNHMEKKIHLIKLQEIT